MYTSGQTVIYGANGVCVIEGVTVRKIGSVSMEYYVLKPLGAVGSTVYVPTQNEKLVGRIRRVKSAGEVRAILASLGSTELEWIGDDIRRHEVFREMIARGDCGELMALVRLLHAQERRLLARGRRLHLADDRILREAEKMAVEEVAAALGTDRGEALSLILRDIEVPLRPTGAGFPLLFFSAGSAVKKARTLSKKFVFFLEGCLQIRNKPVK